MKDIELTLPNMRKPQTFTVYPWKEGETLLQLQSNKSYAVIRVDNGAGAYNPKSPYPINFNRGKLIRFHLPLDLIREIKAIASSYNQNPDGSINVMELIK